MKVEQLYVVTVTADEAAGLRNAAKFYSLDLREIKLADQEASNDAAVVLTDLSKQLEQTGCV